MEGGELGVAGGEWVGCRMCGGMGLGDAARIVKRLGFK